MFNKVLPDLKKKKKKIIKLKGEKREVRSLSDLLTLKGEKRAR